MGEREKRRAMIRNKRKKWVRRIKSHEGFG
jgi:hypothetical protein